MANGRRKGIARTLLAATVALLPMLIWLGVQAGATRVPPTVTGAPSALDDGEAAAALMPIVLKETWWPPPSYQTAAFYYPWYGNPETDGDWSHWENNLKPFFPPEDISSDYYPTLGPYSSADPEVIAQHFAWLRQARVGVIISSWWGQGSREDGLAPLLLDVAEAQGIKVAFHIEPYSGRTAESLVDDIAYLYARYGDHPALFRSRRTSRWSSSPAEKGVFFVWPIEQPDNDQPPVPASYWRDAVDAIHAGPDGGLIIANTIQTEWIDEGHFDGLYNYADLVINEYSFGWARTLPPGAWYVPSVLPGYSAQRIGYPADTFVPRRNGATYDEQWQAALGQGVRPDMVTITSFNEWHEGSQIEPAAAGRTNGRGYTYMDYTPLGPEGYLNRTGGWVRHWTTFPWPATYRTRIHLTTTSDWTTFGLADGATWTRPSLVSASPEATYARFNDSNQLVLTQPLARAEAGGSVEVTVDLLLTDVQDEAGLLVFEIERGHLGQTEAQVFNYLGDEPALVATFEWAGIHPDDELNAERFELPAAEVVR